MADYPAAHSMDTWWFAVDEEGEIGIFDSDERGDVPILEGMPADPDCSTCSVPAADYHEPWPSRGIYHQVEEAIRIAVDAARPVRPPGKSILRYGHSPYYWLPPFFHMYESHYPAGGAYIWKSSPAESLRIEELPLELRNNRHFVWFKDFAFRSRAPANPYEHAINCFSYEGRASLFGRPDFTCFPLPRRAGLWTDEEFASAGRNPMLGAAFIASDNRGRLAAFRTDWAGAIPKTARLFNVFEDWTSLTGFVDSEWFRRRFESGVSEPEGPRHWLEYPFRSRPPRAAGFYLYDMSMDESGPYNRVAEPVRPLVLNEIPPEVQEALAPVDFSRADFAAEQLIQPVEQAACAASAAEPERTLEDMERIPPEIWIDSRLLLVCEWDEMSVKLDDDARVLRRAKTHLERVAKLAREFA